MQNNKIIYVDNAATTPISKSCLQAMMPFLTQNYGNPSSIYSIANTSKKALEKAQKRYENYSRFIKGTDGYYTIALSSNNNYVLDISGGIFANSSNVQLYRRNNTIAQKWIIEKNEDNYYTIYSYNRNYALDVSNASTANGTNIQIYQSNGKNAQKFSLKKTSI